MHNYGHPALSSELYNFALNTEFVATVGMLHLVAPKYLRIPFAKRIYQNFTVDSAEV